MPGIDSPWTAEAAGSGAAADVLTGVLDALPGECDEHPAAALTKTQPTAIVTRTEFVDANDIRRSSRDMDEPQSDRSRSADVGSQRSWSPGTNG
jgi:hypothetical protein